jgi:predicted enzyme related to lactoylglutathione lyase
MSDKAGAEGLFCWHELGTRDAAGAKKFYGELLGWNMSDQPMGDMGTYTLLRLGETDVGGLYEMAGPMFENVPPHWLGYVRVTSADDTANRCEKLGGAIVMAPMDVPDVGRVAVLKEPTGAHFAIFQPGSHRGDSFEPNAVGGFCWDELITRDTEAAGNFFTSLFGWSTNVQEMGGQQYTMFMQGDVPACGMMQMPEEFGDAPSHFLSYITVDDCDAKLKQAEGLGAKPCGGPMDVEGVGRFAVITDPTGATVSIIKLVARG